MTACNNSWDDKKKFSILHKSVNQYFLLHIELLNFFLLHSPLIYAFVTIHFVI